MGYALGVLFAGAVADALGYGGAIAVAAGLTAASGLWVLIDMPATRGRELRQSPNSDPESVPMPASAARAGIPR